MASEAVAMPARDEAVSETDRVMASISGQIRFLSTGDRAALRRMYLTRSRGADGVVVKLLHGAKVPQGVYAPDFDAWQLVAHVAAVLAGTGALQSHSRSGRLGMALHGAGYSENRLLRLTAVRGAAIAEQVALAARLLARAGAEPVNLWTVFDLVGDDRDAAEAARIRVAQDYYAAAARSGEGSAK